MHPITQMMLEQRGEIKFGESGVTPDEWMARKVGGAEPIFIAKSVCG